MSFFENYTFSYKLQQIILTFFFSQCFTISFHLLHCFVFHFFSFFWYRNGRSIHLEDVEILILDEADRLLQLGFSDEVMELLSHTPVQKQTLLFSATMTTEVARLSDLSMKRPVKISVDEVMNVASHLRQEFVRITPSLDKSREALLLALCSRTFKTRTIVFFPLRWQAHRMKIVFGLCGLNAGELHGDMPQASRLAALQSVSKK